MSHATTDRRDQSLDEVFDHYLNLPHRLYIEPYKDHGFLVTVVNLPGCTVYAETWEEIPSQVQAAMQTWINDSYRYGYPLPMITTSGYQ